MSASAIKFRPISLRDLPILRKLNSPIWQRIQQGLTGEQSAENQTLYTATEAAELVYQFSRPVREVEAALKRGRANFRFTASKAVNVTDEDEGKALIARIQAAIVRFGNSRGKDTAI